MDSKTELQENFLDSGYGSNKSNSNSASRRSFGSSKESSFSSESGEFNVIQSVVKRHWQNQLDHSVSKHGKATFWANSGFKNGSIDASMDKSYPPNQIKNEMFEKSPQEILISNSQSKEVDEKLSQIQVAALNHAIKCLKSEADLLPEILREPQHVKTNSKWASYFQFGVGKEKAEDVMNSEDGFSTVVSLNEGLVVYITPSVANILGFTEEMWVGRSFIDFLHPKDRLTFAAFITKTHLGFPFQLEKNGNGSLESIYCRLRQYKSIKTASGFYLIDKPVVYFPFRLTMRLDVESLRNENLREELFKEGEERMSDSNNANSLNHFNLIISATKIYSAYQYPEEVPINPKIFVTRHLANCLMSQVDEAGISYLGYLPQDMIGNSVFDFYHPEDMAYLEEIYTELVREDGRPFKSKPYRFRVSNGTFALLETDWSCFVNPFSWKVESVIGQHRVIQGPSNPNVFMSMEKVEMIEMIEICQPTQSSRNFEKQNEIKTLLLKKIRRNNKTKHFKRKRQRKHIVTLVETLLEQIIKSNSDSENSEERSDFNDRDSMMLGEISPHHDDQGSSESTETPPSYNQLNYRENLERFFLSQPKTSRSEKSHESQTNPNSSSLNSTDEEGRSFYFSHSNESGGSEREDQFPFGLSENLISRHNEKMEKLMVHKLKSREQRTKNSLLHHHKEFPNSKDSWDESNLQENFHGNSQGTKRPGTNSQISISLLKHPHLEENGRENEEVGYVTKFSKEDMSLSPLSINLTPVIGQPEWRNNEPRIAIDGFVPVRVRAEDTWTSSVNPSIIEQVASNRQNQFVYFPTQPSLQRNSEVIESEIVSIESSPISLQYVTLQGSQNCITNSDKEGLMGFKQRCLTSNQQHAARIFSPRTPNSVTLKPIRPTLSLGRKHCYLGRSNLISREKTRASLSIQLSPPVFNLGESKNEMMLIQKSKHEDLLLNDLDSPLQNGYVEAGEIEILQNDPIQPVNIRQSDSANEQLCQLYHEMEIDIYEMERANQSPRCQ